MNYEHGYSNHKLYGVWNAIKQRCYNRNNKYFKYYGAVGIAMCDEWKNDFQQFYNWAINNGYENGLVIDKDKLQNGIANKIYSPHTCRFMTQRENCQHREYKVGKSGVKNISFDKRHNKYLVQKRANTIVFRGSSKTLDGAIKIKSHIEHDIKINNIDSIYMQKRQYNIPIFQFDKNNKFINKFKSARDAMNSTNVKESNICNVIKGKRKTAGGFIWKVAKHLNQDESELVVLVEELSSNP